MPRYHFHIRDHDRLIVDEEGLDFPHDDAALNEANLSAAAMLRDALEDGDDVSHQVIEVTDASGRVLARVGLTIRGPDAIPVV